MGVFIPNAYIYIQNEISFSSWMYPYKLTHNLKRHKIIYFYHQKIDIGVAPFLQGKT